MKYIRNTATLQLDREKCINCGQCLNVCPRNVFESTKGKPVIKERDRCMECGACMINCPVEAVTVKKGVGCAAAVINGFLKGTEPDCGCGCDDQSEKKGSGCRCC